MNFEHDFTQKNEIAEMDSGWHTAPLKFLLSEEYNKIVDFYESAISQDPQILSNYWYLGLAYLLLGQEEQAQLTWFVALNEFSGEDLEQNIINLVNILDKESDRQESLKKYELAWLIRGHIRELIPSNLNNLLKLVWLDIQLDHRTPDKFIDWEIINYLQQEEINFQEEILFRTLEAVLDSPTFNSVEFAQVALARCHHTKFLQQIISSAAGKFGFDKGYPMYAIDLTRTSLENDPDNLHLIQELYWFYVNGYYYKEAIATAKNFIEKSRTLLEKLCGNVYLLGTYLSSSDWDNIIDSANYHMQLLAKFCQKEEHIESDFIRNTLTILAQPLVYITDKPRQYRYFINRIGYLFQRELVLSNPQVITPYTNNLTIDRPLKIGYIAYTFRSHSVGWLCRWLIKYHDKKRFSVYLYAMNVNQDDDLRKWFKDNVDEFREMGRDVYKTIEQIQSDEIDILIDLDSLTLNLTCQVMAFKPAPVQITWLGNDASGIPTIDYFIADPYVLPREADDYYSEKIWRLPDTYLGIDGFEIGVPKLRRDDLGIPEEAIVYMNFQGSMKRYPETIRLQYKILKSVPNSYFLIKGTGDSTITQQLYEKLAIDEGFPLDRIRFIERDNTEVEHRANLQIADIVLDTYPYNGATTTLEVLWSGIPLVTKVGQQFAARNSYTFMINAGITEGIAWTDEEYIEWGIKLGKDEDLRKEISWKLRQSKKTSPLWNGKQFARDMENAYRQMWAIYVKENL